VFLDYETGSYHKWPEHIVHVQGKKICLLSDQTITVCLDGEVYLDSGAEFEIIPRAIDFALPTSVDMPGQGGRE
jgi:diacylglycerol kinase family enzyme